MSQITYEVLCVLKSLDNGGIISYRKLIVLDKFFESSIPNVESLKFSKGIDNLQKL